MMDYIFSFNTNSQRGLQKDEMFCILNLNKAPSKDLNLSGNCCLPDEIRKLKNQIPVTVS